MRTVNDGTMNYHRLSVGSWIAGCSHVKSHKVNALSKRALTGVKRGQSATRSTRITHAVHAAIKPVLTVCRIHRSTAALFSKHLLASLPVMERQLRYSNDSAAHGFGMPTFIGSTTRARWRRLTRENILTCLTMMADSLLDYTTLPASLKQQFVSLSRPNAKVHPAVHPKGGQIFVRRHRSSRGVLVFCVRWRTRLRPLDTTRSCVMCRWPLRR